MAGSLFLPCCLWTARDEDGEVYTKTEPPAGTEGISTAARGEKCAKDAEHLGSEEEEDSVGEDKTVMVEKPEDTKPTQTLHHHDEGGITLSEGVPQETRPAKETYMDEDEDTRNQRDPMDYKRTHESEYDGSKDLPDPIMNTKSQEAWTTLECDQPDDTFREGEPRDAGPTGDCDKTDPPFESDQRVATPGSDQLCLTDDTVGNTDQLTQEIDQPSVIDDVLIHKELQVSGALPEYDHHDTGEDPGTRRGSFGSSGSDRQSGGELTVNEIEPHSLLEDENTLTETEIRPRQGETTHQEHEITQQDNETMPKEHDNTVQENETTLQEHTTTRQEHETTRQNETTQQEQETKPRETDTPQGLRQQDVREDSSEVDVSQEADITPDLIPDPENRDLPSDREIPVTLPGQDFENQVLSDDSADHLKGPPDIEIAQDVEASGGTEDAPDDEEKQDTDAAAQDYIEQVLSELEHAADDVDVDVRETLEFPEQETQQPPPDKRPDSALHDACRLGDLQRVKDILSEGQLDINCRGRGGQTPVMTAVRKEHKEVFHFLVDEGADLSQNADDGNNVLHYACRGGQVEMVKSILVTNMVDINSRGQGGRTALLWAAGWGRTAIFEILAQEGADLTAVKDGGNNVLHVACHGGDMVIVKYILSQDVVDLSARNNDGETAAMIAKRRGHSPLRKVLESRGSPMK